jgi:LPS O-antigen subunit length determinant protein (WzzB/FepE family)
MSEDRTNKNKSHKDDQIDLIEILKKIWAGKRIIIKVTALFFVAGLFVAVFSKNQYTAETTFVPSVQDNSAGVKLGGLASLAGINIASGINSAEISPELYPKIISSIPYRKELLNTLLTIEGVDEKISYRSYYEEYYSPGVLGYLKKYTVGIPGIIINALKNKSSIKRREFSYSGINQISEEEFKLIEQLQDQISLSIDSKDGFLEISVRMDQPIAAAELALKAQETLQDYVLDFKTKKSKEELRYLQDRYKEKKEDFERIQLQLAKFKDQNTNIATAQRKAELLQLQADYDLALSLYSELAKQIETQLLQVKKDTPLFTVLKPVNIPNEKSDPKISLILIIYLFLGLVLSIGYLLIKDGAKDIIRQLSLNN